MTDRLTPERLAELRRIATGEDWSPPQPEDLAALLAERDRLAAQIAADADEDHVLEERAELSRALGEERGRRAAAEHERDRLWMLLETERGLTGSVRLHAEALKRVTAFQIAANGESVERIHVDEMANNLLRVLGPQRPHAAPQRPAPGPWAGFADGEAAEAQETAQRGSEGFENYRCPTDCDPDCGMRCHEDHQVEAKQTHDVRECQARRAAAETYRRVMTPYRPFSGLVIDEESARTGVLPGSLEDVMGLAQAPVIAPQDEGISTTDVMAQAANDAPPDLRTPDQWCAEYDIRILDPDGWRGTHRLAWDFPISLAEFWRRSRTSTTDAVNPAWTRVAADAVRTDTESEQQ